ncbi:hypothetical protein [Acinetobacter baumannii]|uniref:Thymidylate kinase-like domain-containing protein n=1 Tax=Acinetobacter baumannii TaxID=470 RepID=A0AA90HSP9_ACIBA|nr:hypothetical protein [Acinetobacter baumannii]EXE17049.1 thymidylate kinase family protein [Acinetobacter baumannii 1106579]EXE69082.1 thymidylate kinase family protein [Acinetobacter baumannii 83444]KQF70293.1 hypothetical protein APC18_08855 [Acinetobacter baumannii]KRI38711.1 hypothetical protein APD18_09960 [Acinetobacter baumannii]KRI45303.1 hypothetical protein APC31_06915 [Acinetobacter baumannii]
MSNFFLAFEGLDGSGKTTISNLVYKKLLTKIEEQNLLFIDKKNPEKKTDYIEYHSNNIREILWDYPENAPMHELGDMHWLYLLSSWFHLLDYTQVKPGLHTGKSIILESWCYKYLVRYRMKSDYMFEAMQAAFFNLTNPFPVIYLDIDPKVAAERKKTFGFSESGGMDGLKGNSKENFIIYQNTLREIYYDFAQKGGWHVIDVSNKSEDEIANEVIGIIT